MNKVIKVIINLNVIGDKNTYIDNDILFPTNYYINSSNIKELKNIHVRGKIILNYNDEYEYDLLITGEMSIIDGNTLEVTNYPININVNEIVNESDIFFNKIENTLDLTELLWQNIVLEVPIRVSNKSVPVSSGDGWELQNEEQKKIDPRLACLGELLEEKKEV